MTTVPIHRICAMNRFLVRPPYMLRSFAVSLILAMYSTALFAAALVSPILRKCSVAGFSILLERNRVFVRGFLRMARLTKSATLLQFLQYERPMFRGHHRTDRESFRFRVDVIHFKVLCRPTQHAFSTKNREAPVDEFLVILSIVLPCCLCYHAEILLLYSSFLHNYFGALDPIRTDTEFLLRKLPPTSWATRALNCGSPGEIRTLNVR